MGDWEDQPLPPSLATRLSVRADVVNGSDAVVLDGTDDVGRPFRRELTSLQAKALGEALYLAGASASWARFRREAEERGGRG